MSATKIQQCKRGCGQLITVQLNTANGKWMPYDVKDDGVVIGLHNCPNSEWAKQQHAPPGTWSGTTKSGQFVQAKESQEQEKENAEIQMMLKILIDVNRNVLEILGILQDRYEKKQEPETAAALEEEEPSTQSNRSDYGF